MNDRLRLRSWAGPITIGSFVVVAITGILMFFHLNVGLVKLAHEWISWLLVLGVIAHVVLNWKPFVAYFRRPSGTAIMAVLIVLGGMSFLPGGGGPHGRPPFMEAVRALECSSLRVVAQVAQQDPKSLAEQLKLAGIRVQDREQTISEIASQNGMQSMEVLGQVFAESTRDRFGR